MRANFLGFRAKAAIPVAACFLAAVLGGAARTGDKQPKLTGRWEFNADESDDAQQKIGDAQQNSKDRGNNGGGYPGTASPRVGMGWPLGGIGWPMGGGGTGRRDGTGNHGGGVSSDDWGRLAETPNSLTSTNGLTKWWLSMTLTAPRPSTLTGKSTMTRMRAARRYQPKANGKETF